MATIDTVKQILDETLELGGKAAGFEPSSPLLGAVPELDSMAVLGLITALEEKFEIFFEDDEVTADKFETVGSLANFVDSKLS